MSITTDPGTRSSAEIERDVERARDELRDTLEALRDRASPGQLIEQVLDHARELGAPDMMRNMGRVMRENPMPLMLIGAGVGWMMFSGRSGGGRDDGHDDDGDDHEHGRRRTTGPDGRPRRARMQGKAGRLAGRTSEAVGEAAPGLRENLSGAVERLGEAAGGVADSARETASQVGEMASAAYRRVTHAAGPAGEGLSSMMGNRGDVRRQADRGLRWVLREQPLLLGALGLVLGAAFGALVPGTEAEDRLMGDAREDLMDQAREAAEEGYESLRSSGTEARDGVAGMVQEAAHGAREAVTQAAKDMADHAKSALRDAGWTEK